MSMSRETDFEFLHSGRDRLAARRFLPFEDAAWPTKRNDIALIRGARGLPRGFESQEGAIPSATDRDGSAGRRRQLRGQAGRSPMARGRSSSSFGTTQRNQRGGVRGSRRLPPRRTPPKHRQEAAVGLWAGQ